LSPFIKINGIASNELKGIEKSTDTAL